jgi:Ca2+-binding EF-hand superfamily protein
MSYETDLKELYKKFRIYFKNNKDNIHEDDMIQWLKYAYLTGTRNKLNTEI